MLLILIKYRDFPDLESEKSATERQQGQGLKTLTPQEMITRLNVLLAQLKAGNNSQKLKMKQDNCCIHYTDQKT